MNGGIFVGGSIVAAVVAGSLALFAPCCISVMLPGYLASSFPNRKLRVAMTFLFAAGLATVVLPIALGAQALRSLFISEHRLVYLTLGTILMALAAYVLLGGRMHLPVPGRRGGTRAGAAGVYSLGVFSGITTSCCAPVLAGVIALAGVASSFGVALSLGVAYVFGMMAPLFLIALLWERHDWRSSRLFRPHPFTWRLGPLSRTISGTNLLSGLLLGLMGLATLWIGLTQTSMPGSGGWAARFSATLQHYAKLITNALSWIPGWMAAGVVLLLIALLAIKARRQLHAASGDQFESASGEQAESCEGERAPEVLEEELIEHQR